MVTLDERMQKLYSEIAEACKISQRDSKTVNLIAVSKTFDEDAIQEVYDSGIRDFGENKVQELERKYDYFISKGIKDIKWHLIGHLQTNKVKKIIGKTTLIHSVDSLNLAKEIDKYSEKENLVTDVLIQVNISGEESKSGVDFEECTDLIKECLKFKHIHICGLMGIAENVNSDDIARQNFKDLKGLYDKIKCLDFSSLDMKYLSMGMSNDFNIAIEEGSNIIRVGKRIFGERNYNK